MLAACGTEAETTTVPSDAVSPETTVLVIPSQIETLAVATIEIAGEPWQVAVADDAFTRRRGLMEVTDLGDLDGMLFAYPAEVTTSFVMRNTLIPLDVAFFDAGGLFIGLHTMEPCTEEACRLYPSPGLFQWAVEGEAGSLQHLVAGDRLVIP